VLKRRQGLEGTLLIEVRLAEADQRVGRPVLGPKRLFTDRQGAPRRAVVSSLIPFAVSGALGFMGLSAGMATIVSPDGWIPAGPRIDAPLDTPGVP
jgi:hypothetical protein